MRAAAAKAKVSKPAKSNAGVKPHSNMTKIPLPDHLKATFRGNESVEISDSSGDAILVSTAAYPHVAGALSLFAPVALDPDVLAEAKKKSKILEGATTRVAPAAPAVKKAPPKPVAAKKAAPARPAGKAKAVAADAGTGGWAASLPATVSIGPNASLKKVALLVDLRRSLVEEAKSGNKDAVAGYAIIHKGEKAGYVIVQSEGKFVIVAPKLNAPRSQHRDLETTTHRLEILTGS